MLSKSFRATIVQSLDKISNICSIGSMLAVGIVLAIPMSVRADGIVSTDFVLQLDNSVFQTPDYAFKKLLVAPPVINLPDQIIQDQAPVHVTGIQAELKYDFETATEYPVLGAETTIATKSITGRIKIAKIDVDANIVINDGGATAIGRLKATCTDVVVTLKPGKAQALGSIAILLDTEGQPLIKIPWFQVRWSEDAWQVGDVNCTGARNFGVRAKKSLMDYFKKSEAFAPQFKSFIEETAAKQQIKIREFLQTPVDLNLGLARTNVKAYPQRLEMVSGDRFQLRGRIDFAFESGILNETKALALSASVPTQKGFALMLPEGILKAVNEMAYRTGYYTTRRMGSAIAAFQKFRDSGLAVSFVWPELGKYPKEMDFIFDFHGDTQPQLLSFDSNAGGALIGRVLASLRVSVWAQKFSLPVEYSRMGVFETPVQADYQLSFQPHATGSKLQISFATLDANLSYVWDPTYKPEADSVDTETLASEIKNGFLKEPLSFEVDAFPLTPSLRLRASGLRRTNGSLILDLMK